MPEPTPISTARHKALRLLLNKKHRLESGTCLIEGRRFVGEAMSRPGTVETLLVAHDAAGAPDVQAMVREANRSGTAVFTLTGRQLETLSDTVSSQGVLAVVRLPVADPETLVRKSGPSATLVALDGVSDPGNIGTIIRTSAWFGAGGVLLSEGSVELSNPKLLRSTMGAVFAVPVATGVNLAEMIPRLKRDGFRVLAADAGGKPARRALGGGGRRLLVFGSEAHGLSSGVRELADVVFGIPGSGRVESLNVSVAVGISLEIALSGREEPG